MSVRLRFAAVLAAASTVLVLPAAAHAQQVTGLEVRQDDGFATLSWDPVEGATDYQVERTLAGAPGTGVGSLAAEPADQPGLAGLRRRRVQPG